MLPVLWTFRRCPYAIRARLAIAVSGVDVEYREIVLRDKPEAFLTVNPEGTVPVLVTPDKVLIHSYDIMRWALGQNDPEGWLEIDSVHEALIAETKGRFKGNLDRYKYHTRYEGADREVARAEAGEFIYELDRLLEGRAWLTGKRSLADMAVLPFVRQFAHVDLDWFNAQAWRNVIAWLDAFKADEMFLKVMVKRPLWDGHNDKGIANV